MEVHVHGIDKGYLFTRKEITDRGQSGVMVGITWRQSDITFYLNGERVDVLSRSDEHF